MKFEKADQQEFGKSLETIGTYTGLFKGAKVLNCSEVEFFRLRIGSTG